MSIGPSETVPGTLDYIFVIRFNEGKNRLLTTAFDTSDDPGLLAEDMIMCQFANAVRGTIYNLGCPLIRYILLCFLSEVPVMNWVAQ